MSKSKVRDPKLYVKEIIEHTGYSKTLRRARINREQPLLFQKRQIPF